MRVHLRWWLWLGFGLRLCEPPCSSRPCCLCLLAWNAPISQNQSDGLGDKPEEDSLQLKPQSPKSSSLNGSPSEFSVENFKREPNETPKPGTDKACRQQQGAGSLPGFRSAGPIWILLSGKPNMSNMSGALWGWASVGPNQSYRHRVERRASCRCRHSLLPRRRRPSCCGRMPWKGCRMYQSSKAGHVKGSGRVGCLS